LFPYFIGVALVVLFPTKLVSSYLDFPSSSYFVSYIASYWTKKKWREKEIREGKELGARRCGQWHRPIPSHVPGRWHRPKSRPHYRQSGNAPSSPSRMASTTTGTNAGGTDPAWPVLPGMGARWYRSPSPARPRFAAPPPCCHVEHDW
jgi:hypothetical protein